MGLERMFKNSYMNGGDVVSFFAETVVVGKKMTKVELFLFRNYVKYLSIYQGIRNGELPEDHRRYKVMSRVPFRGSQIKAANEISRVVIKRISELDDLHHTFRLGQTPIRDIRSLSNLFSSLSFN